MVNRVPPANGPHSGHTLTTVIAWDVTAFSGTVVICTHDASVRAVVVWLQNACSSCSVTRSASCSRSRSDLSGNLGFAGLHPTQIVRFLSFLHRGRISSHCSFAIRMKFLSSNIIFLKPEFIRHEKYRNSEQLLFDVICSCRLGFVFLSEIACFWGLTKLVMELQIGICCLYITNSLKWVVFAHYLLEPSSAVVIYVIMIFQQVDVIAYAVLWTALVETLISSVCVHVKE